MNAKCTLVLFFLLLPLSQNIICMESSEAMKAILLTMPWADKHEMVLNAIEDAKSSEDGIKKISCEGFDAVFNTKNDIVSLYYNAENLSESMGCSFFLKSIGIKEEQKTPPTTPQQNNNWWPSCTLQ